MRPSRPSLMTRRTHLTCSSSRRATLISHLYNDCEPDPEFLDRSPRRSPGLALKSDQPKWQPTDKLQILSGNPGPARGTDPSLLALATNARRGDLRTIWSPVGPTRPPQSSSLPVSLSLVRPGACCQSSDPLSLRTPRAAVFERRQHAPLSRDAGGKERTSMPGRPGAPNGWEKRILVLP